MADARSRHLRMVILAEAAVLVVSLGGIAWLECRSRRVDSIEQVVNGLGMKLMGTVPAHPSSLRRLTGTKREASAGKAPRTNRSTRPAKCCCTWPAPSPFE